MGGEDDFLQLIAAIYEAALTPDQWTVALANFAQFCGARWGAMGIFPAGAAPQTIHFPPPDPEILAIFHGRYQTPEENPSIPRLLTEPVGTIVLRSKDLSDSVWERTGLYHDVYRPTDTYDGLGIKLLHNEHCMVLMGFNRLKQLGYYDDSNLSVLRKAIPHLQRAAEIFVRLHDFDSRRLAQEAFWNRLTSGVLLLDQNGRVLWSNTKAEALLAAGDGLSARNGLLSAATASETNELRRLIAEAARCATAGGPEPGGSLALSRPSGRRRLSLVVAPFLSEQAVVARRPSVAVLVSDPEERQPAAPALFARSYNLTGREAELAALLVDGFDLEEAADRLGMAKGTARSHLRQIFDKTDTHRQAELVSLFLRSTPPWR